MRYKVSDLESRRASRHQFEDAAETEQALRDMAESVVAGKVEMLERLEKSENCPKQSLHDAFSRSTGGWGVCDACGSAISSLDSKVPQHVLISSCAVCNKCGSRAVNYELDIVLCYGCGTTGTVTDFGVTIQNFNRVKKVARNEVPKAGRY